MAGANLPTYHGGMPADFKPHLLRAPRVVMLLGASWLGLASQDALAATPIKLNAEVGPGFTITLKKGNNRVVTLKAGSYVITVRDRASDHNFRLRGPGLNRATAVSRVETRTWTVSLRPGTYTYLCDPHASHMKASFQVKR